MKSIIRLLLAAALLTGFSRAGAAVAEQQCGPCGYRVTTPLYEKTEWSAANASQQVWSKADSVFVTPEFRWRVVLKMRERFEGKARQRAPEHPCMEDFSIPADYSESYSFGLGDFYLSAKYQGEGYPDLVLLEYVIDQGPNSQGDWIVPTAYVRSRDQIVVLPRSFYAYHDTLDDNLRMLVTQVLPNHRISTEDQFLCLAKLLCVIQGGFSPFWIITSDTDLPLAYRIYRTLAEHFSVPNRALETMPWFATSGKNSCISGLFGADELRPSDSAEVLRFQEQMRPMLLPEAATKKNVDGICRRYLMMDLVEGVFRAVSIVMSTDGVLLSDVIFEEVEDPWEGPPTIR